MHCYGHRDLPAIGACKTCGKGVCAQCAREEGAAIVCSEVCAVDVRMLREMNQRAARIYGIGHTPKGLPNAVVAPLLLCLGCLLGAVAFWFMLPKALGLIVFFLIMAAVSTFGAYYAWRKFRQHGLNV